MARTTAGATNASGRCRLRSELRAVRLRRGRRVNRAAFHPRMTVEWKKLGGTDYFLLKSRVVDFALAETDFTAKI